MIADDMSNYDEEGEFGQSGLKIPSDYSLLHRHGTNDVLVFLPQERGQSL